MLGGKLPEPASNSATLWPTNVTLATSGAEPVHVSQAPMDEPLDAVADPGHHGAEIDDEEVLIAGTSYRHNRAAW